jgi:uncharacterized repeat protein (TIGR02543 family)
MNRTKKLFLYGCAAMLLCVLAGCEGVAELFHGEEPEETTYYTITFDAQGGSVSPLLMKVEDGQTAGTLPAPTRSNNTFGGWYTQTNGAGSQFLSSTKVTKNITVYAKWTSTAATQYTVTFDAQGGSPTPSARTVDANNPLGSLPTAPTRASYTFSGWFTGSSGTGTQYTASYPTVTGNMTLYAYWIYGAVTQYTVTFDATGGSPTPAARTVDANNPLGSLPTEPTRASYTFSGWFTGSGGTGTQYTASYPTVTGNMTLYAYWVYSAVTQYTVTFDATGGSPTPSARTVDANNPLGSLPTEPARDSYTFSGWFTGSGGTGTQYTASYPTVTGNITLYAYWIDSHSLAGLTLAQSLAWLQTNAEEGGDYIITLSADEAIAPTTLNYGYNDLWASKTVSITLQGDSAERTVSLSETGSMFTVGSGVTLTLGSNITLHGRSDNTAALIYVGLNGNLVMNNGAKISENNAAVESWIMGGGVYVYGGTFTMNGGTISDNTTHSMGGGVWVDGTGTFTMNGGTISGNTGYGGGGVHLGSGSFTKTGGVIYGSDAVGTDEYGNPLANTAANGDTYGHAVYCSDSDGKYRDGTAGAGVGMDSAVAGFAGGWALSASPEGLNATAQSSTRILVSWDALADAASYRVYRSDDGTATWTLAGTSDTTSYIDTDSGLAPATDYYYAVSGLNSAGAGPRSGYVYARTLDAPPAPTGVQAAGSTESTVEITWNAVAGADEYRIYRAASSGGTYNLIGTATGTFYLDEGLSPTTTYYYKVSTVEDGYEGQLSPYDSATTDVMPPQGSASITVGFRYGAITIAGSVGTNLISKTGARGRPQSLGLSASGFTDVVWYVDGDSANGRPGASITLYAADYAARAHSVTFTGKINGNLYSQVIPFTVTVVD